MLHDWLDTLKSLLADSRHLVGELAIFAPLPLLVGLILGNLFLDVLQESDFSDLVAIVVDNVAVVINLKTSAVTKVTSSETTDDVAVLVAHLTLLVDVQTSHGVDAALLLLGLPALGLSNDVTVLVVDIAILIDLVADKLLDITLGDASNDGTVGSLNSAILGDSGAVEASERSLRSGGLTVDKLGFADNIAFVVPDLALAVNLLASQSGWVTLGDATENGAAGVDNIAGLVDGAASKSAEVDLLLLFLRPWLGMALDITVLVDDVTVFVDSVADETLGVAFGDLTNTVAVVVFDESILDHAETLVAGEWTLLLGDALVLRNELAATDNLASIIVDLTFAVRLASSKVLQVTLNKATDWDAVVADEVTLLVQRKTIKDGQVLRLSLRLVLERLSMALDVAILVENVTILINSHANKALRIALDDLTNNVVILISNLAVSNNAEALETGERSFRLGLTLVLWDELDTTDDFAGIVPDLAVLIDLLASKLLRVAFDEAANGHTLVSDDIALLVNSLASEDGEVLGFGLRFSFLLRLLVAFGVADNGALLVNDVTVLIDPTTNQLLGVAFNNLADAVAIFILDVAVLDDNKTLKAGERSFLLSLLLGNSLGTTDDIALVVPELAFSVGGDAGLGELLSVTLGELTNDVAVGVDKFARFVDGETLEDREGGTVVLSLLSGILSVLGGVLGIFSSLLGSLLSFLSFADLLLNQLRQSLDLADDIAILVKNLALCVDLLAGAFCGVALNELANWLALLVEDLAFLVDLEALECVDIRRDLNLLDFRLSRLVDKLG